MSERERQVNQGLRALDDAHRLGRIAREEYRRRRRHLLGSLNADGAVVTGRDTLRRPAPAAGPLGPAAYAHRYGSRHLAEPALPHQRPGLPWRQLAMFTGVVVVGVVLLYWLVLRKV